MNEQDPAPEKPVEEKPADAAPAEAVSAESQSQDARRRLRQLLAIPERDRSDAIWDEIIGLEIGLAPGNRAPSPNGDENRNQQPGRRQGQGPRQDQASRPASGPGGKTGRRMSRKPRRGRGGPAPGR